MRKTAQHYLEQTLAHESRHAGFCASHGLEVVEVAVHGPGEGCTSILTPSVEEVRALHTQDPRTLTNCLDSGPERVDKIGYLCSDRWKRTVPLPL
jgi:hypothetical protein